MNFSNSSENIDFIAFIGQKVTEITAVGLELIQLKFECGILNEECSWRLRNCNDILVGINERKDTDYLSIVKAHLISKPIANISYFKTGDLMIYYS